MSWPLKNNPLIIASDAINHLQQARHQLIAIGAARKPVDQKAILLGQLLKRAEDAIKEDFCNITMGKLPQYKLILRTADGTEIQPV